ncbi:MAG: PD-(D/E)XK nuclease family protein [Candidatus Moranbacteria bacterium]|jgi:putative RecB family exonuclease|nr:PD-(D/E)XK nuclease family protein [Candidatus Moranbacteria bacterium]
MRISYSALGTYQNCPLKYKYQNIDKIREPKSKEAVFGTIIHSALKFAHTPGILSPTLEQTLDFYSRSWNSDVFEVEAEERAAFSQGVEMIRKYYEKNNIAQINIVDLESRFSLDLEGNIISGIIDRIDKTEDGYEIVDYKTTKKMPSQEKIDNDLQLSVYLKAFLSRYPEEAKNLKKIKVSLYFLKHGVKLSATRNQKQLQEVDDLFLEVIGQIEEGKFEPNVTPLCAWCGYQKICPMWKHKFKDTRKIDTEEVNQAIAEYIAAKDESKSIRYKIAELQEKISQYMNQEGVERVFSNSGIIARTLRATYKYDDKKVKEILEPLGQWDNVIKIDAIALKKVIPTLPTEIRKKIDTAKELGKETKGFSVKKQNALDDEDEETPE